MSDPSDPLSILKGEIKRLNLVSDEKISLFGYFTGNKKNQTDALSFLDDCDNDDEKRNYLRSLLPKKLTERELFRTVLSVPEMHSIKTKTTTKAATRKIPNMPALAWDSFLTNAFYASTALDTQNRIFSRPNVTEALSALSVEDSVVDMFLKTMEDTNNQRLILLPMPERWSKRYMNGTVKGQPDAIRCGADNVKLLKALNASLVLSVVEVKPEQLMMTLIADGDELFNAYNTALSVKDDGTNAYTRHQKIIRIVRQLFGYMVVNDLKYGLLTTYIRTWFFCRQDDNPDNIYISPAVQIDQSHTDNGSASFLECMYHFENISTMKPNVHSSPPNTDNEDGSDGEDDDDDENGDGEDKNDKGKDGRDKKKDGKDNDKGSKNKNKDNEYRPSGSKNKNVFRRTFGALTRSQTKDSKKDKGKLIDNEFLNSMENYKRSQFSFGNVLGNGRSGVIFMAKLHKQVGALKMVDLYKKEYLLQEILNELKMYLGPLKEIQGIYIPKLLKYGVLHEAFAFILTSFAGESFANNRNITEQEKQLAINGLLAIHKRGVKHGDVRLENIMLKRNESTSSSSVWWIDFAWSKMINNAKDTNMELTELKHLLGMC